MIKKEVVFERKHIYMRPKMLLNIIVKRNISNMALFI